jgi:ribosomal protein S18 acetylase RimI-like enzyme
VSSASHTEIIIKKASAAEVRPLRAEILRPGQPAEALVYTGDDEVGTLHLIAAHGGHTVGIVSTMADGYPNSPMPGDWRIRGMAVRPEIRNRGTGSRMLVNCEEHARQQGAQRLWCNARIGALTLYQRIGMTIEGQVFEIPGIGEHYLMCMPLH